LFEKTNDVVYVAIFKQFFHPGSDKVFMRTSVKSIHSMGMCFTLSGGSHDLT